MPAKRERRNQVLIGFKCDPDFKQEVERIVATLPSNNLSLFLREAVYEKLKRHGIEVDPAKIAPPSRVGVGGRPPKKQKAQETKIKTKSSA